MNVAFVPESKKQKQGQIQPGIVFKFVEQYVGDCGEGSQQHAILDDRVPWQAAGDLVEYPIQEPQAA